MDKASWEFTVGLLAGILIGTGIVQDSGRVAEALEENPVFPPTQSRRSLWEHEKAS